jgi:uncharacterized membrane protein (UPF0127 family)
VKRADEGLRENAQMKVANQKNNLTSADNLKLANTLRDRVSGLLTYKDLPPGNALMLKPCNSIHSFFMRFAIDVVFIDRQNRVVRTITQFKPWRISGICFSAHACIELPAGTIQSTCLSIGDTLSFLA